MSNNFGKEEAKLRSINDCQFIFYPPVEWGGLFQRPHHLALQMAALCKRVLYVQPAGLRNPVPGDLRRLKNLISPHKKRPLKHGFKNSKRLIVSSLPFLPVHGVRPAEMYNAWIFSRAVRNASKASDTTVLWIGAPAPFLKRVLRGNIKGLVVFDWMDDYAIFPHLPARVVDMQYWMLKRADAVFTSSKLLMEKAGQIRKDKTWFLPNGVDLDHWRQEGLQIGHSLSFGQKVIGYFGTISYWLDKDLVVRLAERHMDWNFVFIGPRADKGALDALFSLPNCRHVPPLPYEELPRAARGFDVCWIPFKKGTLTNTINPVKAYEYIATGKPVLSVPLPDLAPLNKVITFATDLVSFEKGISRLLLHSGEDSFSEEKRAAVAPYSWKNLGRQAACILEEF